MENDRSIFDGQTRREFLRNSALTIGAFTFAMKCQAQTQASHVIDSAINTPIGVQFTQNSIIHQAAFEGSCRTGELKNLTFEAEKDALLKNLQKLKQQLSQATLPPEVNLLEPTCIYSWVEKANPKITVPKEQLDQLKKNDPLTDVYVVTQQAPGLEIAERFKKPVIIMQPRGWAVDLPAALRARGHQCFHAHNLQETFDYIRLFAVKKAIAKTKLLNLTNFPGAAPWGVVSCATNTKNIKKRFGLDCTFVNYNDFFSTMQMLTEDKVVSAEAYHIADRFLAGANTCDMTRKDVQKSVLFYLATVFTMNENNCNAFTVECFELCSSMNPWNRRFTPCMTHALLKDLGCPSVCEGDMNAFLAMTLMMYLSRKAAYMGNPNFEIDDNILKIYHSVASLKMNGIDDTESKYEIEPFTKAGFGVTLRHDFKRDKNQPVTIGRFDPTGTKFLVTRGTIIDGAGMGGCGCAQQVKVEVPDIRAFWRQSQNYGHHMTMVFGDYIEPLKDLSMVLNFEIEAIV